MSQEQIRPETTRRSRQQDQTSPAAVGDLTQADEQMRQLGAIDDALNNLFGPPPAATEMIGAPRDQRTVRPTTTSEEFVRAFRQEGGQ